MTLLNPMLRYETLLFEFLLAYGTCKLVYPTYSNYFPPGECPSKNTVDEKLCNYTFPLCDPFKELCKALGDESEPELLAEHHPNKRIKLNSHSPLVVLAFDEVHTLTKPEDDNSWSRFGEIRRAIRGLRGLSLFTLFLSTSGTLFTIIPAPERDISGRMLIKGEVMLPFCELGFDVFAKPLDFSETIKLSQITSEEHLASYGRPLCVLSAHPVRLQLTFVLDSLLNTGRESGIHYSALQPRSFWVALNIDVNVSQAHKSSAVLLNESLLNFSPLCMPRKYQTWKRSKSIPTCELFSRLIIALRPWSPRRLLNRSFQRRRTS